MKLFATLTAPAIALVLSSVTAMSARAGEVKPYNNPSLDRLNQLQQITGIQVLGNNNTLQLLQQQVGSGGSNNGYQTIKGEGGGGGYTQVPSAPAATDSFNPASSSTSSLQLNHSLNPQANAALNLTNSLNPAASAYSGSYSNVIVTPTTKSSSVSNPFIYIAPASAVVNGSGNSSSHSALFAH